MEINEMTFFEGIEDDVILKIKQNCEEKTFNEGDTIFEKGEPATFLYFLEEGVIDLLLRDKEKNLCTLDKPGEVFGWSSVVENGVYTSTSICRSKSTVLCIPRDSIKKIFNHHPDAAVTFYQRIGSVFSKRLTTVIE